MAMLHRNLIRRWRGGLVSHRAAFKAPSLPYQSNARTELPGAVGNRNWPRNWPRACWRLTPMGPAKDLNRYHLDWISRLSVTFLSTMARQALCAIMLFAGVASLGLFGLAAPADAQGAVRSVHGDWQIRCDTPP